MDITQIRAQLTQLGVTLHDDYRASLYLNRLTAAQAFFTLRMSEPHHPVNNPYGMGNDYAFVQAAVTSPNLLNELAETLDLFTAPAVDGHMNLVFGNNPFTY